MNKLTKQDLLSYYEYGWNLSEEGNNFPLWFEFYEEKMMCLLGYNDNTLGVLKDSKELEKEVNKLLKVWIIE